MHRRHDGSHSNCFGCKIRTVTISSKALPTRSRPKPRSQKSHDAKDNSNAWERGVVTETLPNGERTPLLDEHGNTIGLKQWVNEPKWRERKQKLDHAIAANVK